MTKEELDESYIEFGRIIRRKRLRLGLTQTKAAKVFKINRVSLAKLESGKQRILLHDAVRIAKLCKINLNGLVKNCGVKWVDE
ncbi:MAG: helix-turn-helix domain-containing protein [Pseudobdellovibrionaceae bacterium]